eukprot:116602-Alexandrium_andersonii.AAC.1
MCLGHGRRMWYGWPLGRRPGRRLLNAMPKRVVGQIAGDSLGNRIPDGRSQACEPNACATPTA